jgi:hypothetical protein
MDAGTARAMLLASEMEFHEPVTEERDERWCCGKRAQQWVCICTHPCLCGRQAPNYRNGQRLDSTLHATGAPPDSGVQDELLLHTDSCVVLTSVRAATHKLPQEMKVEQRQENMLTACRIPGVN